METFTIGLGNRWWVRALGRNPLVRTSDRIEALVFISAVILAIVAMPIAGAIGTFVHDDRTRLYAEEAQTRHQVLATATEDGAIYPQGKDIAYIAGVTWSDSGIGHSCTVKWPNPVKVGDQQNIWVNSKGEHVGPPSLPSKAEGEAVGTALAVWLGMAEFSAGLVYLVRRRLNRWRYAEWDREINTSHGNDGSRNHTS
jgi:hypothetical protein